MARAACVVMDTKQGPTGCGGGSNRQRQWLPAALTGCGGPGLGKQKPVSSRSPSGRPRSARTYRLCPLRVWILEGVWQQGGCGADAGVAAAAAGRPAIAIAIAAGAYDRLCDQAAAAALEKA